MHLFDGLDGEVIDEVPLVARDSLLASVVLHSDLDICHEVAARAVVVCVRNCCVQIVHSFVLTRSTALRVLKELKKKQVLV